MFNNSTKDYIYIDDEIELLKNYLDMQKLNISNNFDYEIINALDDDDIKIPPMLIQPFIENVLLHGFKGIDYKGKIIIKLELLDSYLYCEIDDNGLGHNSNIIESKADSSTVLIKQFVEEATKREIKIINKKKTINSNGTTIKLYLPIK